MADISKTTQLTPKQVRWLFLEEITSSPGLLDFKVINTGGLRLGISETNISCVWTHQECLWLGSVRVCRLSWVIGVHCGAIRGVEGTASWGICAPLWEADSRRPTSTYFKMFVMHTMTVNSHRGVMWGRVKLHLAEKSTCFLWRKSVKCGKLKNLVKNYWRLSISLCFSCPSPFLCVCVCVCVSECTSVFPDSQA